MKMFSQNQHLDKYQTFAEVIMKLGIILIVSGLLMAWSGFRAKYAMDHYLELSIRGINFVEYGYHVLFRKIWFIMVIIGLIICVIDRYY